MDLHGFSWICMDLAWIHMEVLHMAALKAPSHARMAHADLYMPDPASRGPINQPSYS